MRECGRDFRLIVAELLRRRGLVSGLILCIVAGYGLLAHPAVNWDFSLYKDGNTPLVALTSLLMDRWGDAFLALLTAQFEPWWNTVFGAVILFFATLSWCALWQRASGKRMPSLALALFAALFVSYPLNHEMLIFPAGLEVLSSGYLATGLALFFSFAYWDTRSRRTLAWAVLLEALAISFYPSFAVVYLCGFLALLAVSYAFAEAPAPTLRFHVLRALGYAGMLSAAFVVWLVLAKAPRLLCRLAGVAVPATGGAHDEIVWTQHDAGFLAHAGRLFKGLVYDYLYNALFYEALAYFLLFSLLALVLAAVWSRKRRSWAPLFLLGGMTAANFSLAVIQGSPTHYRSCQSFAVCVGTAGMLLVALTASRVRWHRMIVGAMVLLVLLQSRDLSQWFYNNYRRYDMDKNNFQVMVDALQARFGRDIRKPIVVVGDVPPYPTLRNDNHPLSFLPKKKGPSEQNGRNRFSAGGVRREFYLFARHVCGFVCVLPPSEQFVEEARQAVRASGQPAWPLDGYIREYDRWIAVNLQTPALTAEGWEAQVARREMYLSDNEKALFRRLRIARFEKRLHDAAERLYRRLESSVSGPAYAEAERIRQ